MKKRKRGELPDLRPKTIRFPETPIADGNTPEPPTTAQVEALARKHNYPADFELVKPIQDSWYWWRGDIQSGRDESAAVHRDFLTEMVRRIEDLEECLIKAGSTERRAIFDSVGSHNVDITSLQHSLRMLRLGAKAGSETLEATRPGPKGDEAALRLLCRLFEVNVRAFGCDAPRITNTGQYSGQFFEFADDVLKLFGIRKSNSALGKQIEKAIKIVDETLHHQSP